MFTKTLLTFAAAAIVALTFTTSANAQLLYEPFDYTATTESATFLGDGSQGGALGTGGTWRQTMADPTQADNRNSDVFASGLTFTDGTGNTLSTAGGFTSRENRVGQTSLDIDVSAAGLTDDNTTIWMSALFIDRGFSGPTTSLIFGSDALNAADNQNMSAAGYGVGIAVRQLGPTQGLKPVSTTFYNGATAPTTDVSALTFPVDANHAEFGNATGLENVPYLLAMKVNWNPDGNLDEMFVFNITDLSAEPGEVDALVSATFDMSLVNQQLLDLITIGTTQIDGWDEIRLGTTFADVTPFTAVPEPGSLAVLGLGSVMMLVRRRRG